MIEARVPEIEERSARACAQRFRELMGEGVDESRIWPRPPCSSCAAT